MSQKHLESLGEPTIQMGPLSVWVHGYQYPEANDGWDANWLTVTARCVGQGASVIVSGAILDTVSFHRLQQQLTLLQERLEGTARLESAEPELAMTFKATGRTGHIDVEIDITPDHLHQAHRFSESIDQSYVPAMLRACRLVLQQFPIRNPDLRGGID